MSTPTSKSTKCIKKQMLNSSILPPKYGEHALLNLLMYPLTSPNGHSPVKPAQSIKTKKTIEESDSNIDNIEGLNSDAVMLFGDINKECIMDKSYRLELMEINGTYEHNIEILSTFTYGAEH